MDTLGPYFWDSETPAFFWQFLRKTGCGEKNPVCSAAPGGPATCCSFPRSLSGLCWAKRFARSIPAPCRQHLRHAPFFALSSPVQNRPQTPLPQLEGLGTGPAGLLRPGADAPRLAKLLLLILNSTTATLDFIGNFIYWLVSRTAISISQKARILGFVYKSLLCADPPPASNLLRITIKIVDRFFKLIASGRRALEPSNLVSIQHLTVWGLSLSGKSSNKLLLGSEPRLRWVACLPEQPALIRADRLFQKWECLLLGGVPALGAMVAVFSGFVAT